MNTVNLIGRLTADIELKQTPSGKLVSNFALAVNDGKDKTYFIDCVAWEKTAELIERYMSKGTLFALSGRLTTRSYQDKNGNNRKTTEVLVDRIDFLEKKDAVVKANTEGVFEFDTGPLIQIEDDDLPF